MTRAFIRTVYLFLGLAMATLAIGGAVHLRLLDRIAGHHRQVREEWQEANKARVLQDGLDDVAVLLTRVREDPGTVAFADVARRLRSVRAQMEALRRGNDTVSVLSGEHSRQEDARLDRALALLSGALDALDGEMAAGSVPAAPALAARLSDVRGAMQALHMVYEEAVREALSRADDQLVRVRRAGLVVSLVLAVLTAGFLLLMAVLLHRQAWLMVRQEKMALTGLMAAQLAHEVRNPLGIIKSAASVLRKGKLSPEETAEMSGYLAEEADRIDRLVEDLLRVRQAGRPEMAVADIAAMVDDVVRSLRPAAVERGMEMRCHDRSGGTLCRCDSRGLRQAVLNLLLNAMEVTPAGGMVDVATFTRGGWYGVSVLDFGPGLAPSVRARLFEPFVTTRERGLGIGLSVVRRVVEEHGGRIDVRSSPGKGAEFILLLPLAGPEGPTHA